MNMKYLKILGVSVIIIILLSLYYYNRFSNYYSSGENDKFEIKVGETLKIRLRENHSTGYSNCWLNENKSKTLKLVNRKYESGLNEMLGYDGAGGIVTLTLKAQEKGIDTIKIANCPLGRDSKKCSDFSEKNIKTDNQFIIKIDDD